MSDSFAGFWFKSLRIARDRMRKIWRQVDINCKYFLHGICSEHYTMASQFDFNEYRNIGLR